MKQKEKVKQMLEDSDTEFYSNLIVENAGIQKDYSYSQKNAKKETRVPVATT